jgi:uncharacterized protein (TIGR03067 family)
MKKSMFGVGALLLSLGVTNVTSAQEKQSRHTAGPEQEKSRHTAGPKEPKITEGWLMVGHVKDGKKAKADVKSAGVVYDGKTFAMALGSTHVSGRYHVNPHTTPHQIDVTLTSKNGKSESIKGIYEEKGDKMEVCYAPPGKARPTAFSSRPGSGDRLYVYQRVNTEQITKRRSGKPVPLGKNGNQKHTTATASTQRQPASTGFAPQSFAATGPTGASATQLINPITAAKQNPAFAAALAGAVGVVVAAPLAVAAAGAAGLVGGAEVGADAAADAAETAAARNAAQQLGQQLAQALRSGNQEVIDGLDAMLGFEPEGAGVGGGSALNAR